jgi:hypothetical protein
MHNGINTRVNNLAINHNNGVASNKADNAQSYTNAQVAPVTVEKQITHYSVTHADAQLNLVAELIMSNDYCSLVKLLHNNSLLLAKLVALPKEQSPVMTAANKKYYRCVDVICNAILKYASTNSIPEYLQQYLFIYACENPDADISRSILNLYKNTNISLTPIQINSLLTISIKSDKKQILDMLISKFIAPHEKKHTKYAGLLQYTITNNNQQAFALLLNQHKRYNIDIFNSGMLDIIIRDIIKSKNNFFVVYFLMQSESTANNNILSRVLLYFIFYTGSSPEIMSFIFNIIAKYPQLLLIKHESNQTILHAAFRKIKPDYALKLLSIPIVKKHINNPFYYASLRHKYKYNVLEEALINCRTEKTKNSYLKDKQPRTIREISYKNMETIRQWVEDTKYQQYKRVDYLDLATLGIEQKSKDLFTEVLVNISNMHCIGVYLFCALLLKHDRNNGQSLSFGDENAMMNMIDRLIFLNCHNINVYIPFSGKIENNTRNIIINKISYLLNIKRDSKGSKGKSDILKKEQCTIKLCFIEKNDTNAITDEIVLTFDPRHLFTSVKNIKNVIALKPFLFTKQHEELFIKNNDDINDNNYQIIAANNPDYSILKEEKDNLPLNYDSINKNKQWHYDLLIQTMTPDKANLVIDSMAIINKNIAQIEHGVIYGLHHHSITNKDAILNNWMSVLKKLAIQTDNKPIVLSIPANTFKINIEKLSQKDVYVFNLIDRSYNPQEIEKAIKAKKNIIILYPNLPKVIFYSLIDQANIPILTEGANTTSYVLQTATPYLSLLPYGLTEIPKAMGDPLQALLLDAMSHKITMDPQYLEFTKKLFVFVKQENYQDAINFINEENKKSNKSNSIRLFYDEGYEDEDLDNFKYSYRDKVTIYSLLSKGELLSASGKEYLLQVLNPDIQSVVDYIQQCKDSSSKLSWHFKLMQHHVNLEINNTVDVSLHKLFKYIS